MNQQQMSRLLGLPDRTLRDWKRGKRKTLYRLLESLDFDTAQRLLDMQGNADLVRLLENERSYTSFRDFERDLYAVLVSGRESKVWRKLAQDTTLSKAARARAAYLYSFLTDEPVKLTFASDVDTGLYHGNRTATGDGLARLYGLKNGIDVQRFHQYKMTGKF